MLIGVLALALFGEPAEALESFFGHQIAIAGDYPEVILRVDGREVLKNAILSIDDVLIVAGVPALVGTSSAGGNACDGAPFVISLPSDGAPKIDGPLDTCFSTKLTAKADQLTFSTSPVPGQDGESWTWTPQGGFVRGEPVHYEVDQAKGWSDLRSREIGHPSDLFGYGEIAQQLDALLGADKPTFQSIISGVGSGEFAGDNYFGSACTAHMCGMEEAMVFLDARTKRVYLAWKPYQKKIIVRPVVQQWPSEARVKL